MTPDLSCSADPPHPTLPHPAHLPQARYLRAILTSHAKCGQLEAALALVKAAKEEQLAVRPGWGASTGFVCVVRARNFVSGSRSPMHREVAAACSTSPTHLLHVPPTSAMQGRVAEGAPTAEDGLRHLLLFISDDTL